MVRFNLPSTFGEGAVLHDINRHPELVSGSHVYTSVRNAGEGKTLSRIAKIRSRSLSNFPLAKQLSIVLREGRVRVRGNDLAIADRATLVRNDETTLVPQYLSALVPSKRIAFTLAEVLITLGIIGVVAAMTMPTLISNHKKQVWVNQLKKTVSTLEQGFQKMMADDEVFSLEDTEVFQAIDGSCIATYGVNSNGCKNFHEKMKKYFKIIDIAETGDYQYSYISSKNIKRYPNDKKTGAMIALADGAWIMKYDLTSQKQKSSYTCDYIRANGGIMCAQMGIIVIDVNGKKGPNIEGRDMFSFRISDDGHLVAFWSKSNSVYNNSEYWRNNSKACGTPGVADAEKVAQYGSGCAARIIENGWVMDY